MTEGIIFDKDGTLIDFDAFWVSVSKNVIKSILEEVKREDIPVGEMLASIGVYNEKSDIDGILCKGTYEQIATAFNCVLEKYGCMGLAKERIIDKFNKYSDSGEVKPTCENIKEVLAALKEYGIMLAVVTTDNLKITKKCLEKLDIIKFFDKIYTDDGIFPVKPAPDAAFDFSKSTGISVDKIMMVGDTMTDVRFAKNAGISVVGVGAESESRQRLAAFADAVFPDVSYILEMIREDK